MITKLNGHKSPITHNQIYKIDMNGYDNVKWDNHEEYFTEQLDSICEQQFKIGYSLSTITNINFEWILVFQPHNLNTV